LQYTPVSKQKYSFRAAEPTGYDTIPPRGAREVIYLKVPTIVDVDWIEVLLVNPMEKCLSHARNHNLLLGYSEPKRFPSILQVRGNFPPSFATIFSDSIYLFLRYCEQKSQRCRQIERLGV
jgi:hypothetical protein